jgi:glycosyltransferase involved in cell wall biosynthesis
MDSIDHARKSGLLPVSCTIIAFNEADRIARTIESLQGLVDEVIVVDSGSTDGTQALCEKLGARVVHNPWTGFGPQKRFAEDQAKNDIILNLDADEWLIEPLREEIRAILAQPTLPAKSFRMRMTMVYPHRDKPCLFADYHNYVRLYDRRATRFANSLAHDEVPPTPDAIQLRAPAYHQSIRSLAHIVTKGVSWYGLQKKERKTKGSLQLMVRLLIELPFQFFKYYVVRRHIFGGLYGLLFSVTVAFTRWLRICILAGY